jgi:membrane protease YdiL (CAAX protease family)
MNTASHEGDPYVTAAAVSGIALAAGATIPLLPRPVRPAANVVATAAALAVAVQRGLGAADLGTDPAYVAAGARAGAVVAGLTAGVVAATVGVPATRGLFADRRVTEASPARAAYEVLVRIPFTTALTEELLFRGALLGAWQRAAGTPVGIAASSLTFGVWHVLPALEAHEHNPAGADIVARAGGRITHVLGTVATTAAAGALFAALRLRSRSVVASVTAHAVVNELGYLAARWAHRHPQA